jgi:3-oxoadipate enol-lactonase
MAEITLNRTQSRLTYREQGSGPVVVLLHAFPLDSSMWEGQINVLSARYRVVAPDLPGFGGSDVQEGLTVDAAADAVAELLDRLGADGPVVVGGLSMGGYVALAFARLYPQRVGGLILADTKSDADDEAAKAKRDEAILKVREHGAGVLVEDMIPKLIYVDGPRAGPIGKQVRAVGNRQNAAGIAAALRALRDRPDARPGLAHIAAPALVIVGEHDAVTPPAKAEELARGLSNARLVHVPEAGHLSNLENPDVFTAAVGAFLDDPGA